MASATESAVARTGAYLEGRLGGSLNAAEGVIDSVASLPLLHRFDDRLTQILSLDRYRRRLVSTLGSSQQAYDLEDQWGGLEQSLATRVARAIQLGLEPILITSDSLVWPSLAADLIVAGGDALSDASATTGNALIDASANGYAMPDDGSPWPAGRWAAGEMKPACKAWWRARRCVTVGIVTAVFPGWTNRPWSAWSRVSETASAARLRRRRILAGAASARYWPPRPPG